MEGNLKIELLDPVRPIQEGVYGSQIDTTAPFDIAVGWSDDATPQPAELTTPTVHVVYAKRRERGGSETLRADTQVGLWKTRFEIRRESRIDLLDTSWALRDERGRLYDIEAINDLPGLRPSFRWIYAIGGATSPTSTTEPPMRVAIPDRTTPGYLMVWGATKRGTIKEIDIAGGLAISTGVINISSFSAGVALKREHDDEDGFVWVSSRISSLSDVELLSQKALTVVFDKR